MAGILKKHPSAYVVAQRGLRIILESDEAISDLTPTAFSRFQAEGADVVSPRFQYVESPNPERDGRLEAYKDMLELAPSPRTAEAVRSYLRDLGEPVV